MATLRELIDEQERQASYVRKNPASIGHGGSILGSLVPFSLNQNEDVRLKEEKKEKKRRLVEAEKKARKKVNKLLAERKKLLNEKKKGSKSPPPEVMPETPPDITVPDTPVDSTLLKKPIVDPQVNLGPEVDPNAGAFNNIPNQTIGNNNRPPPPVVELGELPQANTPASTVEEVDQIEGANTAYEVSKILGINLSPESVKQTQEMLPDVWDAIKKLSDKVAARDPYQSQLGPLAPIPRAPSTNASDFYDYNSLARIADFSGAGPAGTSVQDRQGIDLNAQVGNLRDQRETEYLKRLAATQAARQGQIAAEDSRRKAYEATTDQTAKEMDLYTKVVDTLKKGQPTADTAKNMVELYKNVTGQDQNVDLAQAKHDEEATKLQQKDVESRRNIIANWRDKRASAQEALHQYMVGDGTERAKAQLSADVTIAVNNGTLTQKEGQELRQQAESIWKERIRKQEVKTKVKTDADVATTAFDRGKETATTAFDRGKETATTAFDRGKETDTTAHHRDLQKQKKANVYARKMEILKSKHISAQKNKDVVGQKEVLNQTQKLLKEREQELENIKQPGREDIRNLINNQSDINNNRTNTTNIERQKIAARATIEAARLRKSADKLKMSEADKAVMGSRIKTVETGQKEYNKKLKSTVRFSNRAYSANTLFDFYSKSHLSQVPTEWRKDLIGGVARFTGNTPIDKESLEKMDPKTRVKFWTNIQDNMGALFDKVGFRKRLGKEGMPPEAINTVMRDADMWVGMLHSQIGDLVKNLSRSESGAQPRTALPDELRLAELLFHPGKSNTEMLSLGIKDVTGLGREVRQLKNELDTVFNTDGITRPEIKTHISNMKRNNMKGLISNITSALSLGETLARGTSTIRNIKEDGGGVWTKFPKFATYAKKRNTSELGMGTDGHKFLPELSQSLAASKEYKKLFNNENDLSQGNLKDKTGKAFKDFLEKWSENGKLWGEGPVRRMTKN